MMSSRILIRVGLAVAEAAMDHGLALQWRRFEQSLLANECPADLLADALLWSREHFGQERTRLIEEARVKLVAEYGTDTIVTPPSRAPSDTETVH